MSHPNRLRSALIVLAVAGATTLLVACDDILADPTFREWCGDTLCAWKLEQGHIVKAPTWTEKDYGVSFTDTPTTISQAVTSSPHCMEVSMIANVDPSAQMTVEFDFDRDGTVDVIQQIGASNWSPVVNDVSAPDSYDGMIVYVKKQGTGNAVLAELRIQSKDTCAAAPIVLKDLPIGEICDPKGDGSECKSGVCCTGLCGECCDAKTAASFGEQEKECAGGVKCDVSKVMSARGFFLPAVPTQCGPNDTMHPSGAPCIANDDCASNVCDGVQVTSSIGLDDGGDVPCPAALPDAGGANCYVTKVVGGYCR